jgi:Tetracyclin repressor-like, C-terminal domain
VALPLAEIADETGPAKGRLRRWLDGLCGTKRRKAHADPALFAMYHALAQEARQVVHLHVAELVGQLARILRDGVARGEFRVNDPDAAARAVFDATARFHHPAHAAEWADPNLDAAFGGVWRLILAGLGGDQA